MDQQQYEQSLDRAYHQLVAARTLLQREISSYPTPISGCDQQYIRLMADRTRISQAIQSLNRKPFVATPRTLEQTAA